MTTAFTSRHETFYRRNEGHVVINNLLSKLQANQRRGSKPRCHLFTHGSLAAVAARLTRLCAPFGHVTATDKWMPRGFDDVTEAQLDKAPSLVTPALGKQLHEWWLGKGRHEGMTPNFDIASTCIIGGQPGLMLVEAKAHDRELIDAEAGRVVSKDASPERAATQVPIGQAIEDANRGLAAATSQAWKLDRDSHYQMSNRFAWSWKLAELGVPVILVYLGFLRAVEMEDKGKLILSQADWEQTVMAHSQPLFPAKIWNNNWAVGGVSLIPLIRTEDQPLSA